VLDVTTVSGPGVATEPVRKAGPRPVSFLTRLKRVRFPLFVVIASIVVAEGAYRSGVLATLEHLYTDLWHRTSGVRFTPDHVALVVIDDQSLAEHGDQPMVFWTPLFARAAATLREAGVTVIGVDFLFGFTPEDWINKLNLAGTEGLKDYDLAFRQELNQGKMVLVGSVVRGNPGEKDNVLLAHPDYLLSLPNADFVSHVGFADLVTDADGGVRRFEVAPHVDLPPILRHDHPRDQHRHEHRQRRGDRDRRPQCQERHRHQRLAEPQRRPDQRRHENHRNHIRARRIQHHGAVPT